MDLNDEEDEPMRSVRVPHVKKFTTNEKQLKRLLVKRWRL